MWIWLLCGEINDGVDTIKSGEELVLARRSNILRGVVEWVIVIW